MQRGGHEVPQGEIETTLAQLRAELLGLARVGRHDQLFAPHTHTHRAGTRIGGAAS